MTGEYLALIVFGLILAVIFFSTAWVTHSHKKEAKVSNLAYDLMKVRLDLGVIKFSAESSTATDAEFRDSVREMLKDFNP